MKIMRHFYNFPKILLSNVSLKDSSLYISEIPGCHNEKFSFKTQTIHQNQYTSCIDSFECLC